MQVWLRKLTRSNNATRYIRITDARSPNGNYISPTLNLTLYTVDNQLKDLQLLRHEFCCEGSCFNISLLTNTGIKAYKRLETHSLYLSCFVRKLQKLQSVCRHET